jgi:hypothetical protein
MVLLEVIRSVHAWTYFSFVTIGSHVEGVGSQLGSFMICMKGISQQEHNRVIPFMHVINDPNRDPTPSTCDPIVTSYFRLVNR